MSKIIFCCLKKNQYFSPFLTQSLFNPPTSSISIAQNTIFIRLPKFSFQQEFWVVKVGSRNMEFKCQLHCTKHFNLKQIKSYRSEKVIKRNVLTFNLSIEVYFLLFSRITFSVQKNFYYKVQSFSRKSQYRGEVPSRFQRKLKYFPCLG